jgi:hypothetical protein
MHWGLGNLKRSSISKCNSEEIASYGRAIRTRVHMTQDVRRYPNEVLTWFSAGAPEHRWRGRWDCGEVTGCGRQLDSYPRTCKAKRRHSYIVSPKITMRYVPLNSYITTYNWHWWRPHTVGGGQDHFWSVRQSQQCTFRGFQISRERN